MEKESRLSIRITPYQKQIITQAAQMKHTTLSQFVLENACEAAEKIALDNAHFMLPKDKWQAFCDALDRPPKKIPALKALFKEPSIFNGE